METLLQDFKYGLRMLAKNPVFTALAVLALGLGVGAATTMFSVVHCSLLNPFPYADSHRLVRLVSHDITRGQDVEWAFVSAPEFLDYQEQNRVFDGLIGYTGGDVLLAGTDAPEFFHGSRVTGNLFRVLGVPPLLGRSITAEDAKPGAPPVVVLSYKVWRSKFAGDRGIVGRTLVLNGQPTTVIGVMPPRFTWQDAELWLPATLSSGEAADQPRYFRLVGHLKSGVSIKQAVSDVTVLSKRFAAVYMKDHPKEVIFGVESLTDSAVRKEPRATLYILMGAVGLLLLIACVNVANLLLARATVRAKEFAIRASLGAGRARLVHQALIESLLVALGGAALGCLLAREVLGGLVTIIPPRFIPNEAVIRINGPVLLFTLGAALLSTLLFGLAPALHAARKDIQEPLKASSKGAGESLGHSRLRNLLVVSEVALSLVLLTGASLLIRSFVARHQVNLGYSPDNVLIAIVWLPQEQYKTAEQRDRFHLEVLRRVRALPGVVSATLGNPRPPHGDVITIEIAGKPSAENQRARWNQSGDRFFETLNIRVLHGRAISEEDLEHSRKVAVVNRTFVSKYFEGEIPLGRQIKVPKLESLGWYTVPQPWFEIIGVVEDIRDDPDGPEPQPKPEFYLPYTVNAIPFAQLYIRTTTDPAGLLNSVRRVVAGMDKELPVTNSVMLRDHLKLLWYSEPRFVLAMLVAFASLGLALVSMGVYSVLSYSVSQRTHEIGVRMAMGAEATDVRQMVLLAGLRWLAVGIGIGVLASIALAKILQNRIWGIKSADPLTLGVVAVVLTAAGLAACYFPARRATRVDPMEALRYE